MSVPLLAGVSFSLPVFVELARGLAAGRHPDPRGGLEGETGLGVGDSDEPDRLVRVEPLKSMWVGVVGVGRRVRPLPPAAWVVGRRAAVAGMTTSRAIFETYVGGFGQRPPWDRGGYRVGEPTDLSGKRRSTPAPTTAAAFEPASRRGVRRISESEEVLAEFGARRNRLSPQQRNHLDELGYLVLPDAIDSATLEALRARFDELVESERDAGYNGLRQDEEGASWLVNLVDKDAAFDAVWNHPVQLAAVAHVLGWSDMKLFSLKGRSALPGHGQQRLHVDWPEAVEPGAYQVCNSAWMLDDFTTTNGSTRVVPGSHRWARTPNQSEGRRDEKLDEVYVTGKAGSCAIFNSHIWHGGTLNNSTRPRRVLLSAFVRREHRQQVVQKDHTTPQTMTRLTAAQRYLLEV